MMAGVADLRHAADLPRHPASRRTAQRFRSPAFRFDIGTTNRSGAASARLRSVQASRMLVDGDHPHWWIDPAKLAVADIGDFDIALGDIANSLALIQAQAAACGHLISHWAASIRFRCRCCAR